MKTCRIFLLLCFFFVLLIPINGQNQLVRIKGTVLGQDGKPLIGATIVQKGTQHATLTDQDGKFELDVSPNSTLVVSYVGYESTEQVVKEAGEVTVTLKESVTELEDVVVIGYGTQKKRDVTGSIVSIKGEQLDKKAYINPLSALQGSVAGLMITNSGVAGAPPDVRIRGVGSISNTNPLYIVDGIFTDNMYI
ncbi:MAG: carboxypeptidase-like regulatory domain-containing protein [Bacteroidales bacterium]